MGDYLPAGKLSHYVTSHPGQLSLTIPPWVGAMSTEMVTATTGEENGELCIAVAPEIRTASILTQLVRGTGCQMEQAIRLICVNSNTDLIVLNYHRFKGRVERIFFFASFKLPVFNEYEMVFIIA